MDDRALDRAIILDTEEDICTKIALTCGVCGEDLTVVEVCEEPETAIILRVESCWRCIGDVHQQGYFEGQDQQRGY